MSCQKCPDLCASRSQIVLPDLPEFGRSCRLLVIGEAPGAEEDQAGKGFVGRSGRLLHRLLEEQGLRRGYDYGCANIVRCRPPSNRKPTVIEQLACLPFLAETIDLTRPEAILTVGGTATCSLTGMSKLWDALQVLGKARQYPLVAEISWQPEIRAVWPSGCRLYAMPHTSPLAWNRFAPDGHKWSEIGRRVIAQMGKALRETV